MDITKHSTAQLSAKGGSVLSIVLAGIAAASSAQDTYERRQKEEKQTGNGFPANYFDRAAKEQNDLYFGLLDALAYLPATTLVEAAAQIGQAMSVISMAYDELPDNAETNHPFKKMEAQVDRLLHSALRVIEAQGNFSMVSMGLGSLRMKHCDPWAETEHLVAELRREGV
jgi:hypothetical protein